MGDERSGLGDASERCSFDGCDRPLSPAVNDSVCHRHALEKWVTGQYEPMEEALPRAAKKVGREWAERRNRAILDALSGE